MVGVGPLGRLAVRLAVATALQAFFAHMSA
jgi:hypothetical protein